MGLILGAYDTEKLKKLIGFVRIFGNGERTKMFKERENTENTQTDRKGERERERESTINRELPVGIDHRA